MCNSLPVLIVLLFAVAVLSTDAAAEGNGAAGQPQPFKITTKKSTDSVQALQENAQTVLVIKCPSGISNASIERQGAQWPKELVLRLHLKGLENFKAANGQGTLHAAASFKDGKYVLRQWKNNKENQPIDKSSSWWMENRAVDGGKAATAIPLKEGFLELVLPSAFFEGNPKAITIEWIDFYR